MSASSIRRDLSVRIGLIILLVNLLSGIVFHVYSSRHSDREFQGYTVQLTDNIADILTSQLWLVDMKMTREICKLLLDTSHLQGLQVRDHQGQIVFSSDFVSDSSTVHYQRDLSYKGFPVGRLDVFFTNRAMNYLRRAEMYTGMITVLCTVLASFLALNLLLNRYLSQPLENLQADMKKMAEGIFPLSGMKRQKLEVQNIVDAFNELARKLQLREKEVEEKTKSLTREVLVRKKTAELLRLSQENWERTFNAMKDIVIIFDGNFRIVQANMAAFDFMPYPRGNIIGMECGRLFPEDEFPWEECVERITSTDWLHDNIVFTHSESGNVFNANVVPILGNDKSISKFVFSATDITLQKKLESELVHAQKMETIGNLAGGIAHDFNNILAAVIGYNELALSTKDNFDETEAFIRKALDGSYRARELVKQILTFGRKGEQDKQLINPAAILHEVLHLIRATIPSTITIREEIQEIDGLIRADATRIHQVIVNICTNGVHAMEAEHGRLTITLKEVNLEQRDLMGFPEAKPGLFVQVSISDTGVGMTAEEITHIFEPYYTTKEVGKGSGLGLALAHAIVVDCGGLIRVASSPGKGSSFSLYLPLTNEDFTTEGLAIGEKIPQGNGQHILIVDDERVIAEIMKTALERIGYKASAYSEGEKALQALTEKPYYFDLLITDQTMPNCTGLELAERALMIKPDLPVMLCTGYSTRVSPSVLQERGIQGFAMKPISITALADKVNRMLNA